MSITYIKISDLINVFWVLIIAVIYYWMAQLGFIFAWQHTNVSAIWPPSALAFIAIFVLGYRVWPGIWLGAFLANASYFWANPFFNLTQVMVFSSLIAVGNTLEAVINCFLVRKFIGGRNPLCKAADTLRFMIVIMFGGTVSALIGSITVALSHPAFWGSYPVIWFTWWLGDFSGLLIITPIFWAFHQRIFPKWNFRLSAEFIGYFSILILVNSMIFSGKFFIGQAHVPITYLSLPLVVWLTYRFEHWGGITAILATLLEAIQGSSHGFGPFVTNDANTSLLLLQTFMATLASTSLLLAAALYERRQAQQEIILREQYFRAIVEHSLDMISLVNPMGVISYSSSSVTQVMGYPLEEHMGRSIFEFIHPGDEPRIMAEFTRVLNHPDQIVTTQTRVRHKNGSWRWVEGTGQNLLNDPAIGAIVVNYRDITERKLAQERFEKIVESSPLAEIITNQEGKIILVNRTAEILFGYSREELLNMKVENLVPQQFRKSHVDDRKGFYQDPQARPMGAGRDLYGLSKDGKQLPIEVGLTPIELEKGGRCVLASIMDITERKKAEEILKNELKQATRLADMGTLAAIVAHELRTPLGVIQMASHNLKHQHKELAEDKHLDNIETKVWEGNRIIDNLLSYARIKMPSFEPCRMMSYLMSVLLTCKASLKIHPLPCTKTTNWIGILSLKPMGLKSGRCSLIFLTMLIKPLIKTVA